MNASLPNSSSFATRLLPIAFRVARRSLPHHDAEDVAQDIALNLLKRQCPLHAPERYAAASARNRVRVLFRRRKYGPGTAIPLNDIVPAPAPDAADRLFLEIDVWDLIRAAETALGERAVAALGLLLAGYTQDVVAETLECSRSAVQRLLSDAIDVLAAHVVRLIAEKI